jgi:O-antigen/teichoic acid export membrane protein
MAPDSANTPSERTPPGAKIVRNVVFGALRTLLVAPIPLLLTPFIIKHVGTNGLGVWAIFLAINGVSSLADLGVFGTLTKHVSEHYATQDFAGLNRVINAGLAIFTGAAALSAMILTFGSAAITALFFQKAPVPTTQLQHAIRLLSVAVSFNLLAFPFSSVLAGLQRLDFANLVSTLSTVAIAVAASLSLSFGWGVQGLAGSVVLGASVNLALSIFLARRVLPAYKLSMRTVGASDIKELFSFSLKMYVTQVGVVVHNQIEKFLLAYFSGLTAAGWYDIANDLSAKVRGVPSLLLAPLLPAASDLQAQGDQARTLLLYRRSQKYLALTGVLIAFVTGLLAHRFVQIWLGPGFSPVAMALIILVSVQLINLTSGPGLYIFIGRGNLGPGVRSAIAGIVLNVALSTALIWRFGFPGAVYGTALSVSLATIYFVYMFHRETEYPFSFLLAPYAKPLTVGFLITIGARKLVPIDRLGWAGLGITALLSAVVYLTGLILARYFDDFDLRTIGHMLEVRKAFGRMSNIA